MPIFTYALHAPIPAPCRGGVLTIGNFDGVHLGHQALLAEASRLAQVEQCAAIAVTFDPHPSQLLRPDRIGPPLTTIDDRAALLLAQGVDHVLIIRTSHELLQLTAPEFFKQIVIGELHAKALAEGFNFGFGKNREGTIEVLKQLCAANNVQFSLVPPYEVLGQPASSRRVREELLAGNVDLVEKLLGRPYRIHGIVGAGQKRGQTIGFPTANLQNVPTLLPADGVYAVRAFHDGKPWPAAANVGPNPTFGENARKLEVHLIGFHGDLYGQPIGIDFVKKIRDTKKFANVDELVAQIRCDVDCTLILAQA